MAAPTEPDADVLALGNALVDVLSHEEEAFLADHHLAKGTMALIDTASAEHLYDAMGPGVEVSGGSAANTATGIASLGGQAVFVGKVADDQLGRVFAHDLRATGVLYDTPPLTGGEPTGRCLIVVTPDAERTLNTFLGASSELGAADIDPSRVARCQVTFLEGYLWDAPPAQEAFRVAARHAHEAGRRVALTLSDPFCVERHRADWLPLIESDVDVLFANETEICALYQVDDFEDAVGRVPDHCEVAAITRSEKGSLVLAGSDVIEVDAHPVAEVVDTTGAGDLYAAGFLFGMTHGLDLPTSGRLASLAAAEVISHLGARPQASLRDLAVAELGLEL